MNRTLKTLLSVVLLLTMLLSVVSLSACKGNGDETSKGDASSESDAQSGDESTASGTEAAKTYTYRSYASALGTKWNPHTWETNADDLIQSYITSPFCTMSIKDSENGEYQWVFEMATSIEDVTKDHKDDLTKYSVTLADGATADTTEDGYVFEIKLNPDAKWENGDIINADSYIYSMQQLLNPKMRNYRANLYWGGESAVAGGLAYYNSEAPIYKEIADLSGNAPVYEDTDAKLADGTLYFTITLTVPFFGDGSIKDYIDGGYASYFVLSDGTSIYDKYKNATAPYGMIQITDDNVEQVKADLNEVSANLGDDREDAWKEYCFYFTGEYNDKVDYDESVGCYKVDDYTIRYVTQYHIDYNYFLTSCTSTWLVYEPLYEAGKKEVEGLTVTDYCTSKETTISYGTYKLDSFQAEKQMVFVQNENWYGFEKQDDGSLISYTNFDVDGEKKQQYQATSIVIDVMEDEAAKLAFLKGDLTEWSPSADDLVTYSTSEQLYQVDETYTMSLFFNSGLDALKAMDASKGNTNSVVISNTNFRKAMSLAFNRAELVTATPGYKPAYAIMNNLYFYDVYNDPTSSYRSSDEAMQAICNLYGVEYGEGKTYATLKDAYESIDGYNLTEAKELFKTACQELVDAGLYTEGQDIVIRVGYAAGEIQSSDEKLIALMNTELNAALEGSGFGKLTLEAVGNLDNRYAAVTSGEFAIGYGAWGGAAFYPFRNFQVYMDPDNYDIHEAGCWDPTTEKWTLTVNGEEVELTCQEWSNALVGNGPYATADFATQLSITAQLEEKFLETYYRIPLYGTTACSMLSYQVQYYTEEYNIMYDFGGLRLMSFKYDDAAWEEYVASQNGQLNYE